LIFQGGPSEATGCDEDTLVRLFFHDGSIKLLQGGTTDQIFLIPLALYQDFLAILHGYCVLATVA
jgi:hypothetical protein